MGSIAAPASPSATVVQAYRYALDPTPGQARTMAMFAGASRFAYNAMLAEVKSTLTARQWETRLLGGPLTPAQGWSLAALRRTWNANKDTWAPWWREVSKEAFNHGLDDRRSVQLPRLGRVRTHENTRKLHRRATNGTARILRATVSRDAAGRWLCSFTVEVQRAPERGHHRRIAPVGVDVGVRDLLVAADTDGSEVLRVGAPRSLGAAQQRLARLQRKAARQTRGSNRRQRTVRRIGTTHARAGNVRRDTVHKATSVLAKTADVVVVEDLNVAGMGRRKRGIGARGRGMNRAVADAAMA